MKKTLLLSAMVGLACAAGAQTAHPQIHAGSAMQLSRNVQAIDDTKPSTVTPAQKTITKSHAKYRSESYDFVEIGYTYYDLQTNAAIGRRSILHDDGTISAAWTFSGSESTTWPDRGSVVNYYDGTDWGSAPVARTENKRTGWPSLGELGNGSMYTISHDASVGGLVFATNSGKGQSDWSTKAGTVMATNGGALIWNRTANIGDTIFALAAHTTSVSGDWTFEGIENPVLYSRSTDGGQTWSAPARLPGYDSTRYLDGSGDTYAIDVNGDNVAIVIGGRYKDLTLFKSSDRGDNWTSSIIDSFIPRFEWGRYLIGQQDQISSNDGAVDVLLDNNGQVHVTSGRVSYWDDDTTNETAFSGSYYGLWYWNESTPEWRVIGTPINMDGQNDENNSPWTITSETTASLDANGNPPTLSDGTTLSYAARYGGTSISTHPSMSVDANNNLFVTWDCPVEFTFNDYLANFRDVHITMSMDGGLSWTTTQNATQIRSQECVFACLTKKTDDFVHMIFQMDEHPGTNLQNSGAGNLHPNVRNTIYYAAIPVEDIRDSVLGQNTLSVRPVEQESKVFVVSQNQPNPFSESTDVVIYLRAGSDLTCTVTDAMGKVVAVQNYGYKNAGNHKLTIDGSELTSGVYFYTLTTEDSEITKKMQVLK